MREATTDVLQGMRKGGRRSPVCQVWIAMFIGVIKDLDWSAIHQLAIVNISIATKPRLLKKPYNSMRVRNVFIAPYTMYFSAASAIAKKSSGSRLLTDGWRNWVDSERG